MRVSLIPFIIATALLAGCAADHPPVHSSASTTSKGALAGTVGGFVVGAASGVAPIPVTTATGAILGRAFGKTLKANETLLQKLEQDQVQVIAEGEKLKLVLPSDRFFYARSPHLNPGYAPTLNNIATFLKGLTKVSIQVAGYTDDRGSWQKKIGLSRQQAQNVADYLWKRGVDTRVLVATGFGDAKPVAKNTTDAGRSQNRRIEITLQQIPV